MGRALDAEINVGAATVRIELVGRVSVTVCRVDEIRHRGVKVVVDDEKQIALPACFLRCRRRPRDVPVGSNELIRDLGEQRQRLDENNLASADCHVRGKHAEL